MNKTKITLIAFAIILSGCSANQAAPTDNTSNTPAKTDNSSASQPTKNVENPFAELDQAIASGDLSKCKTLSTHDQVITCETNLVTSKALSENDSSWCQKASTDDAKNACSRSFDKKNNNESTETSKLDQTIAAGDYTKCIELSSPDQVQTCETNILTAKALTSKDPSWCQKATVEEAKTSCINTVNKK